MKWDARNWHRRFSRQAGWTEQLRQYCIKQLNLAGCRRILEAGCGTGVISASLQRMTGAQVVGLDLRQDFLAYARLTNPAVVFIQGDALALPFTTGQLRLRRVPLFFAVGQRPGGGPGRNAPGGAAGRLGGGPG